MKGEDQEEGFFRKFSGGFVIIAIAALIYGDVELKKVKKAGIFDNLESEYIMIAVFALGAFFYGLVFE